MRVIINMKFIGQPHAAQRYRIAALAILVLTLIGAVYGIGQAQNSNLNCFVRFDVGFTVNFSTADYTALEQAIGSAPDGAVLQVAGTCAGGTPEDTELVLIQKNLTLVGGYAVNNGVPDWGSAPEPNVTPTIIDAQGNSRVLTIADGYTVILDGLTIQNGNTAECGGGIFNGYSNLTLRNMTFTGNTSEGDGGGLFSAGRGSLEGTGIPTPPGVTDFCGKDRTGTGVVVIENSRFTGNESGGHGGGLGSDGQLIMVGTTLDDNTAGAYGGGAAMDGLHLVINSTVSNNAARFNGAGLYVNPYVPGNRLINSTISGNRHTVTNGSGDGGALFVSGSSTYDVINATIVLNTTIYGVTGLYTWDAEVRLRNTVIDGSCGTEDDGTIVTNGNNVIGQNGNSGNCPVGASDTVLAGRFLEDAANALADNGGPTLTHLPKENGVLINAGDAAHLPEDFADLDGDGNITEPLPVDQRWTGFARNAFGAVDVGAVERITDTAPDIVESNITEGQAAEPFIGTIAVQFNDRVNVAAGGATLTCDAQSFPLEGLPASDVTDISLQLAEPLPIGADCQFQLAANTVTDVDVLDPPDNLAADYTVNFTVAEPQCFAEYDGDNVTDFYSANHSAVQLAVNAANGGDTIRIAGTCQQDVETARTMVTIDKSLEIIGGHDAAQSPIDWQIADPIQNPTVLDANGYGRIFHIRSGYVTLRNLIVQNGDTRSFLEGGSGIVSNYATVNLINSIVRNNRAHASGGGVHIYGRLNVVNSSIVNNTAGQSGGGIVVYGRAELVNATISGNSASSVGGVFVDDLSVVDDEGLFAVNTTIVNNQNGGVLSKGWITRLTTLSNSIVSGNTGYECSGFQEHAGGSNVFGINGNSGGCPNNETDIIAPGGLATIIDTTLTNHGGFVPTHALVLYGPAFNNGNPDAVALDGFDIDGDGDTTEPVPTDARGVGFARQVGPVDVGAYENGDEIPPYVWRSNPSDGQTDFQTGYPLTLTFNERVNVSADGISLMCDGESIPLSGLPAANISEIAIVEPLTIESGLDCTLFVPAAAVEDTDTNDPPNQMASDFTLSFSTGSPGCFVDVDGDNVTDFWSADQTALQNAHDSVASGATLRVAGECRHQPSSSNSPYQDEVLLEVIKSVTIMGGWDVNNGNPIWNVPADPTAHLTILDANHTGYVIYVDDGYSGRSFNLTLDGVVVQNGTAFGGSGVRIRAGDLNILRSTFRRNISTDTTGAVNKRGYGDVNIIESTFVDNEGVHGGAVSIEFASTTIANSTFINNTGLQGGALYLKRTQVASIINSTFSANNATDSGSAILIDYYTKLQVTGSTITGNTGSPALHSFRLGRFDDEITFQNSIISGNPGGNCGEERIYSLGYNVIGANGDAGGCEPTTFDVVPAGDITTILDTTLRDNGGLTPTHALEIGSPAINAGSNALLNLQDNPHDQRGEGYTRIVGDIVDIGAYESAYFARLDVDSLDVSPDNAPLGEMQSSVTVTNSGNTGISTEQIALYLSQDSTCDPATDMLILTHSVIDLAADASKAIELDVALDRQATYPLVANQPHNTLSVCATARSSVATAYDDFTYFPWDMPNGGKLDGVVTPSDVMFIVNRLGNVVADDESNRHADVNGDGVVDEADADAAANLLGYAQNEAVNEH